MQVGVRGTGEKGGWEASARVMGNTALFQQMEAASQLIKRDVVFAASLYVA